MEYTRLGKSGLKVSKICVGCMSYGSSEWAPWVLDEKESIEMIKYAYESGVNFFDNANAYSNGESERILGRAIKQLQIPRKNIVIATKGYFEVSDDMSINTFRGNSKDQPATVNGRGLSRKHLFEAVDASLERLQTSYIDLYQIHRWDYDTDIEETMEALHDLVKCGKIRYIGASSMWAWQFAKAQHIAEKNGWTKFVSMQNLYNLVYREEEREMIPLCLDQGVGLIPYSPLAKGVLSIKTESSVRQKTDPGIKTRFGSTPERDAILVCLKDIAEKRNVTPAQIAIAWLLSKPAVAAPIIGMNKKEYLDTAIAAIKIKLTQEEIKFLEEPYQPRAIMGHQ
jgi:aryl-alcohol dehydrogenase-like predicted oxidoreductase